MKAYIHLLPAILLLFSFNHTLSAQHQHDWCHSDEFHQLRLQNDPGFAQSWSETEEILSAAPSLPPRSQEESTLKIIPVVVHVIYATESDNISVAQIRDGIRVLNEDFRRLNADTGNTRAIFKDIAADIEIEFQLAGLDPQGNCTDGITRTQSNRSLTGNNDVKNLINWDNSKYYNIWLTRNVSGTVRGQPGGIVLGYSSFPRAGGQSFSNDGTVMRHDEFGTIGTAVSDGRTLTHETGHYLALYHPFEDNAGGNVGGCFRGDQVADTPPVDVRNFGCNFGTNSCNNDNPDLPDQIENYMDYADCVNMFTAGQKSRMVAVVNDARLRRNLTTPGNHSATGITNPPLCAPVAKLAAERRVICTNEDVQLFDFSEEGLPSSWQWTLTGSSSPSATQQNPIVQYASPGLYDVTLQVSNSSGSDQITLSDYLYVKAKDQPFFDRLWVESFEQSGLPFTVSPIDQGGDGSTFALFTNAGSHQNQSVVLNNNPDLPGEVDELISPAILTKGGQNLNLFFDFAFAARQNDNDDLLEVWASRDCGENWIRRRFYNAGRLQTAPLHSGNFVPTASEWQTETINFDAYVQDDPILIKFRFVNGGGNSLYLDNIRFGEGPDVSLAEDPADSRARLEVFPQPSAGPINVQAYHWPGTRVSLRIRDLNGRILVDQTFALSQGELQEKLNLDLASGIYTLEMDNPQARRVARIVVR